MFKVNGEWVGSILLSKLAEEDEPTPEKTEKAEPARRAPVNKRAESKGRE